MFHANHLEFLENTVPNVEDGLGLSLFRWKNSKMVVLYAMNKSCHQFLLIKPGYQ